MTDVVAEQEGLVAQYMEDVLAGRVVVNEWTRRAVQRHLDDLERGADRGLVFVPEAATTAIRFLDLLRHTKGEWAGQVFRPAEWQRWLLWTLFGWYREDPESRELVRRFRVAYLEMGRKNGKSTLAAAIGLYLLLADGEPGAEIYSAATKRDQARIIHGEATRMAKASPVLMRRVGIVRDNIHVGATNSKYEALSADAKTLDGLNVHGAIIDELHAHPNRELWDVLDTATGSRRQPLLLATTTAGTDRQSICYEQHEYTEKVLAGLVEDDSHFGLICSLDEGDEWEDESLWPKSNPNLGVSKKWDDMRRKAKRAQQMPAALSAFLQFELSIWVHSVAKWMNPDLWRACGHAVDPRGLRGRTCYGGLDLSSNIDITAWVMVFPPQGDGDRVAVLCRFWIPEENVHERVHRDRAPYDAWIREGFLTTTPGNVVDYDFILAQIEEDAAAFDLVDLAFDRWGAVRIYTALAERDITAVQMGQGVVSMSPPMKALERLIMAGRLAHGGNPVLAWMADNLVARRDAAGNIKPDKQRSREKIDGMVALIMALDRLERHRGEERESVYQQRGIRTL